MQSNFLSGVRCVSAPDCWAVGYYWTGSVDQTLTEHWDGSSWAIVTSPNTSTAQLNFLLGVTCVSASDCWAAGYHYNDNFIAQTLIERWDGTSWVIVPSPNTSATQGNYLQVVTCVSGSECWAIGYYWTGSFDQTLIERWDGTSWAIVSSPNTSTTQNNLLYGMTCESASDCWAAGYYYNNNNIPQTLTEHWDGASWTIVSSPNTSTTQHNDLNGVTCASASDCWAAGYYYNNNNIPQTLTEHWDGASWAIVSSPNTSDTQDNDLFGVTCASASECWAVGYYYDPITHINHTLIDSWDGTSWSIVSSPNTIATRDNLLFGVTCVSASDCWAVGNYYNDNDAAQTLVLKYTAAAATPTPRPRPTPLPRPTPR
jgi:hypothetical protein